MSLLYAMATIFRSTLTTACSYKSLMLCGIIATNNRGSVMRSVSGVFRSTLQSLKRHPVYSCMTAVLIVGAAATHTSVIRQSPTKTVGTTTIDKPSVKSVSTSKVTNASPASDPAVKPTTTTTNKNQTDHSSISATTSSKPAPSSNQNVSATPPQSCQGCNDPLSETSPRKGALILSSTVINVPMYGRSEIITARSDSGELISIPYAQMPSMQHPLLSTGSVPATNPAYMQIQNFVLYISGNIRAGSFTYKLRAIGADGGSYTGQVTFNIVEPSNNAP